MDRAIPTCPARTTKSRRENTDSGFDASFKASSLANGRLEKIAADTRERPEAQAVRWWQTESLADATNLG